MIGVCSTAVFSHLSLLLLFCFFLFCWSRNQLLDISLTPGFIRSRSSFLSHSLFPFASVFPIRYAHLIHGIFSIFSFFFYIFSFFFDKKNKGEDKNMRQRRFVSPFVIQWPSKTPVQIMVKRNDVLALELNATSFCYRATSGNGGRGSMCLFKRQ